MRRKTSQRFPPYRSAMARPKARDPAVKEGTAALERIGVSAPSKSEPRVISHTTAPMSLPAKRTRTREPTATTAASASGIS